MPAPQGSAYLFYRGSIRRKNLAHLSNSEANLLIFTLTKRSKDLDTTQKKLFRRVSCWVGVLLIPLFLLACTTQGQEGGTAVDSDGGHSREALVDAFRANGNLLYVYGTGDSAAATAYRKLLSEISSVSRRTKAIIRSDKEVTDAELHQYPLYLLGTPANNAVLARLLPQLPFYVAEKTVDFNQQQYGDHPVLSLGFYPNPLAPGLPLSLMTGLDDQDILDNITARFKGQYFWFAFSGWGYELYDGGARKVMGFFNEEDPKQWKIGGKTHWDFTHDGEVIEEEFAGMRFFNHQIKFRTKSYAKALADSVGNQLDWQQKEIGELLGLAIPQRKMEVHLYPSIELKGLATGDTRPVSSGNDGKSLFLVIHPEFVGRDFPEVHLPMIRQLLPKTAFPCLELGLAVWPQSSWEFTGWRYWAGLLANVGNALSIRELTDAEIWAHESPYLKGCMSAALVDFLISKWGKEAFLKAYSDKNALDQLRAPNLETEFLAHLKNYSQAPPKHQNLPHRVALPAFHKAFNFAHEGYQIFNGYASTEATVSMNYLAKNLHCNTVAVIPYSGYQDVNKPSWLEFSDGAGAENDESIVHSLWSAQQAGMQTMLKPQVWPWNSWTGEIAMQSEEDWAIFFDRYFRWIRHYAIMGEMYGADVLCVGVEFSKATLQRPDDWRRMIQRLRPIFSGKITYAANWGDEFEQCKFWDAVDYIGINCYYPLTKKDKPSQKDLDRGFSEILDKVEIAAKTAQKEVLFTEIGFRSVERTWQNPHAEADDRASDFKSQEMCYKSMIQGLSARPWCKGVYLWKWPAYMDDAKYDLRGFTPLGRPSEKLVEEWFR